MRSRIVIMWLSYGWKVVDYLRLFLRVLVKLPVSKELYVFVCSRRRTPVGTKFIQNRSVNNDSGLQTE